MDLFIALFIAHILGDFFLQSAQEVTDKQTHGIRSYALYRHGFVHFLLNVIALFCVKHLAGTIENASIIVLLTVAFTIAISHILIDLAKREASNRACQQQISGLFIGDQIVHILTLLIATHYLNNIEFHAITPTQIEQALIHICALLLLTRPTSLLIQTIFHDLKLDINTDQGNDLNNNFNNDLNIKRVGQTIGFIERFIIYFAVLAHQWQAIGFLIAAKSIFRFGDLNDPKNRNKAEMILLGTLLSFGFGILISQLASWWLSTH